MSRDTIFAEVDAERQYQETKWGNDNDDKANLEDWVSWISHHSSRWFPGGFRPHTKETRTAFRKQMVKVAALAVAAIEAIDRQEG